MTSKKNKWSFKTSVVGSLNNENDPSSTFLRKQSPFFRKSQHHSPQKDQRSPQKPAKDSGKLYFQKIEDSKQENALRRYKTASEGYLKAKENVKKQSGKESDQDLLMETGHLYRVRLENGDMLQRALTNETRHFGENMWEMSLRNTWTVESQIGDLYAVPQSVWNFAKSEIEYIGYPLKEKPSLPISQDHGVIESTRQSRWGAYEHFMEKCEKRLAKIAPHKPDFVGFQVVGSKVMPHSTPLSKIVEEDAPAEIEVEKAPEKKLEFVSSTIQGPSAQLSCTNLFFLGEAGEIVHKTASFRNTGSTALFFKWRRKPVESLSNSYKVNKECDKGACSCFYIISGHGSIAPGETKDFMFSFHSPKVGTFVEIWTLDLLPKVSIEPLVLRGLAVYNDENREWREKFTSELNQRAFSRAINETVDRLLDLATRKSQWGSKDGPDFIYSKEAFHFMKENVRFEPPLYFHPDVQAQFEELVSSIQEVMAPQDEIITFNGSLSIIITCINNIYDKDHHERLHMMATYCMKSAAIPPHPSSLLFLTMYRTLFNMTDVMVEVAENVSLVLQKLSEPTETDNSEGSDYSDDSDPDSKFTNKMNASNNEKKDADIQSSEAANFSEGTDIDPEYGHMKMIEIPYQTMEEMKRVLMDRILLFDEEMMKAKTSLSEVIESMRQNLVSNGDMETADWNAFLIERHMHV